MIEAMLEHMLPPAGSTASYWLSVYDAFATMFGRTTGMQKKGVERVLETTRLEDSRNKLAADLS